MTKLKFPVQDKSDVLATLIKKLSATVPPELHRYKIMRQH